VHSPIYTGTFFFNFEVVVETDTMSFFAVSLTKALCVVVLVCVGMSGLVESTLGADAGGTVK
jgi:hypothetical protein